MCVVNGHVDFLGNEEGRLKAAQDWKMLQTIEAEKNTFSTRTLLNRFLSAREEFVVRNHVKKDPIVIPSFGIGEM